MNPGSFNPDPFKPGDPMPATCALRHRLFTQLGEPIFRRSETDGAPVMVVRLGERDAAIPLRSLQMECGIEDDSPDGRMLGLIAESLDYVTGLRIGQTLPPEVRTGEASWEPDPVHLKLAATRLRLQLVDWLGANSGPNAANGQPALDAQALLLSADDPALRQQVQAAFDQAAIALGLPDATEVVTRVESLARELAYIEALRDRLLRRVREMTVKLGPGNIRPRSPSSRTETLTQVRRLAGTALKQIAARFEELDAQTSEVMSALRNADSQRIFIRSNRDWLYRSQRAWEPLLREWDTAPDMHDEAFPALLARSYQFLAPRFMAVTEWTMLTRQRPRRKGQKRMVW
jgi:hypothetical protein